MFFKHNMYSLRLRENAVLDFSMEQISMAFCPFKLDYKSAVYCIMKVYLNSFHNIRTLKVHYFLSLCELGSLITMRFSSLNLVSIISSTCRAPPVHATLELLDPCHGESERGLLVTY